MKIQEGDTIYYYDGGMIQTGTAINLTEKTFELEGCGFCCEGNAIISFDMLGYHYFTSEEQLKERLKI